MQNQVRYNLREKISFNIMMQAIPCNIFILFLGTDISQIEKYGKVYSQNQLYLILHTLSSMKIPTLFQSLLSSKCNGHINGEVFSTVLCVKYLFKYCYKGHDCAFIKMKIQELIMKTSMKILLHNIMMKSLNMQIQDTFFHLRQYIG